MGGWCPGVGAQLYRHTYYTYLLLKPFLNVHRRCVKCRLTLLARTVNPNVIKVQWRISTPSFFDKQSQNTIYKKIPSLSNHIVDLYGSRNTSNIRQTNPWNRQPRYGGATESLVGRPGKSESHPTQFAKHWMIRTHQRDYFSYLTFLWLKLRRYGMLLRRADKNKSMSHFTSASALFPPPFPLSPPPPLYFIFLFLFSLSCMWSIPLHAYSVLFYKAFYTCAFEGGVGRCVCACACACACVCVCVYVCVCMCACVCVCVRACASLHVFVCRHLSVCVRACVPANII